MKVARGSNFSDGFKPPFVASSQSATRTKLSTHIVIHSNQTGAIIGFERILKPRKLAWEIQRIIES